MDEPRPDLPGTAAPAGWSFVEESPLAGVSLRAGFVVEIAVDTTGFRVGDRLVSPATVAKLIAAVRGSQRQPVLLVIRGSLPTGTAADLLIGALADALDDPVLAADSEIWVTSNGVVNTAGAFRQWHPRGNGQSQEDTDVRPRHHVVGATVPPPAIAQPGTAHPKPADLEPLPRSEELPADLELLDVRRWSRQWTALTAPPSLEAACTSVGPTSVPSILPPGLGRGKPWDRTAPGELAWVPVETSGGRAEAVPASAALWISGSPWGADDRTRLRRALNGRYDGYARVVVRTLAEQPGLRSAGASADLVADLVALLAYHTRERDAVNVALRGGGPGLDGREALVARGAAQALRRLPAVLGPVFALGRQAAPIIGGYRPGAELVEPAFVDVALAGFREPDATVEFVIWSVSARRLDRIGSDGASIAVFPPGSRFAVLAVDPPNGDGEPTRVLLCDRAGDRPGNDGGAARLLDRLRGASPVDQSDRPLRLLAFAPGLDDLGRWFVAPSATDHIVPTVSGGEQLSPRRGGVRA